MSIPTSASRDPVTTVNVLALLGRTVHEINRGNADRAILYLGIALVALKYKKFSFVLQGVLTGGRVLSRLVRPRG